MKNVLMLHGTGGSPEVCWFPYIKNSLDSSVYEVSVPQLPDAVTPNLADQLSFVLENFTFDESTTIVGHSAGCPLILSILESIDTKIEKAILVAGFFEPLSDEPNPILQEKYNWEKIKGNAEKFIFINSVDDPWGCDDKQGKRMFDNLGGTLVTFEKEGHMGSDKFNQPYKEFPLLKALIENQ